MAARAIAAAFVAQGRDDEAALLLREVVAALGDRDPDSIASTGELAETLQARGRAAEAEPLLRDVVATRW